MSSGPKSAPNDGMTLGKEFRGEGALPASNADELIHGVSLDLLRLSEVLGPESHDVRPAFQFQARANSPLARFRRNALSVIRFLPPKPIPRWRWRRQE